MTKIEKLILSILFAGVGVAIILEAPLLSGILCLFAGVAFFITVIRKPVFSTTEIPDFSQEYDETVRDILDYALTKGIFARVEPSPNGSLDVIAVDDKQGIQIKMCEVVVCKADRNTEEWKASYKSMTDKIDEFAAKMNKEGKNEDQKH